MMTHSFILLLGSVFLFGLRHGVDWDHIAAISNITGADETQRKFISGFLYIIGHAVVVFFLGLLAIMLGITLPGWIESFMGPVVGITLVLLGLWLLYSISAHRGQFRMLSRWMLFYEGYKKLHAYLHKKLHPESVMRKDHHETLSGQSAFMIGALHGIGAETPTQMLLFLTVAGVGGKGAGIALLIVFILGLIISNTIISLVSIFGFANMKKRKTLQLGVGIVSGVVSFIIGLLFLMGQESLLPAIF